MGVLIGSGSTLSIDVLNTSALALEKGFAVILEPVAVMDRRSGAAGERFTDSASGVAGDIPLVAVQVADTPATDNVIGATLQPIPVGGIGAIGILGAMLVQTDVAVNAGEQLEQHATAGLFDTFAADERWGTALEDAVTEIVSEHDFSGTARFFTFAFMNFLWNEPGTTV